MPPKTKQNVTTAAPTTAQSLGSLLKSARDIMRKDKGLNGDLDRLPLLTWIMFLKFLDDLELQGEEEAGLAGTKFRPAIERPYRWRDWAANPQGVTGDELLTFINQDECTRPDGKRGPGLFAYLRGLTSSNGDDRRTVVATVFKGVDNRMRSGYLLRDVINKIAGIHFTSSGELHTLGSLYESMLREMRDAAGDSGEFYTPRAVVRLMVEVTDPRLGECVLDPAAGTGGFLVEAFNHMSRQVKTVGDRKQLQENSLFGGEPKPLPYLLCQMNLLLHGLDAPQIDPGNSLRFKLSEIGEKDRVNIILTNPPFGGEEEKGIQGNFPEDKQTAETALLFLQLIMRLLQLKPTGAGRPARAAVVVPESVMGADGVAKRVRALMVDSFNLHTIVRLPKGVFEPYSDIQTNLLFFDTSHSTKGIWFYLHEVPLERRGMKNPCYTRTSPLTYDDFGPLLDWWHSRIENPNAWFVGVEDIRSRGYSFDFRDPRSSEVKTRTQVVSNLNGVAESIAQADAIVETLRACLSRLVEQPYPQVDMPLGRFLHRIRDEIDLAPDQIYDQVTVRLYGKGVVRRARILGADIKTKPQFLATAGQLIISKIDARNGAFGIVPTDLMGAVVTNDFPLFRIDTSLVLPAYLALLLNSTQFVEACKRASKGTTNRKRLKEELFLRETLPIPSIEVQEAAVQAADQIALLSGILGGVPEAVHGLLPSLAGVLIAELRQ